MDTGLRLKEMRAWQVPFPLPSLTRNTASTSGRTARTANESTVGSHLPVVSHRPIMEYLLIAPSRRPNRSRADRDRLYRGTIAGTAVQVCPVQKGQRLAHRQRLLSDWRSGRVVPALPIADPEPGKSTGRSSYRCTRPLPMDALGNSASDRSVTQEPNHACEETHHAAADA